MEQLTTNSTLDEIQNTSQTILDNIALKDNYIFALESKCNTADKLLKLKDQIISNREAHIKELKTKLDELMELLDRAIKLTERNI